MNVSQSTNQAIQNLLGFYDFGSSRDKSSLSKKPTPKSLQPIYLNKYNLPQYPCRKYHGAFSTTQRLFPNSQFCHCESITCVMELWSIDCITPSVKL